MCKVAVSKKAQEKDASENSPDFRNTVTGSPIAFKSKGPTQQCKK